jgi:hypothetical protein
MTRLAVSIAFTAIVVFSSCIRKEVENIKPLLHVSGVVWDSIFDKPVAAALIRVDVVRTDPSWGIITNSRRDFGGEGTTDERGQFSFNAELFEDPTDLFFKIIPAQKHMYLEEEIQTPISVTQHTFELRPGTRFRISFKNTAPAFENDEFTVAVSGGRTLGFRGNVVRENCGTVTSNTDTWVGADVCGSVTYDAFTETPHRIAWKVVSEGKSTYHSDTVIVKGLGLNEYAINY